MSREAPFMGWAKILNLKRERCGVMKIRKARLEFGVNCLSDIRFLFKTRDRFWSLKGEVPLVYVTIEDRLPGEQVGLNFQASTEMLDKFMRILEQDGLRFSCDEIVPGLLTICRVEKDRGGLTVIGANDGHGPGEEPEG
jgi:hypothetical protein